MTGCQSPFAMLFRRILFYRALPENGKGALPPQERPLSVTYSYLRVHSPASSTFLR